MKTILTNEKNFPSTAATSLQFVIQDFLKMFLAALVCGLVFSILATGLVLLVMGNAEARVPTCTNNQSKPNDGAQFIKPVHGVESSPGVLIFGDGCVDEAPTAIESDWLVRVNGRSAEIRVMQDYLIPTNAPAMASFTTRLPAGASFVGLKIYTAQNTLTGKIIKNGGPRRLDRGVIRDFVQHKQINVALEETLVQTQEIKDLQPGELLTVEYSYAVPIDTTYAQASLSLLLNPVSPQMVATNDNATIDIERPLPTNTSVWVEWIGQRPLRLLTADKGISVDETRDGIAGVSWFSPDLVNGKRFNLVWEFAK